MVKQLRVGSDFTGLAVGAIACRQAAEKIGRQFVHTHSCDKSRASQKFVQYACKAEVMQKNILERDLEACGPCDTFIWTAPCVTFSSLGNQKGMDSLTGTLAAFHWHTSDGGDHAQFCQKMLRLYPCTSNTEPSAN